MQLRITDLQVTASVGVYAWEQQRARKIIVNLWVEFDGAAAAQSDALPDTLDYDALARKVTETAAARHYNLLESLLNAVGEAVLSFPRVEAVRVEIGKPGALPGAAVSMAERFVKGGGA